MASNEDTKSTIEGLAEGLKNIILERFSSPLILSFTTAWLIVNFKLLVIVLSDTKIKYKLDLIQWYFKDNTPYHTYYWSNILILPLVTALLYTFAYPFISRHIQVFITWRKILEMRDRQDAEKNEVFDKEHIDGINLRHGNEVTRYKGQIQGLQDSVAQLEAQLNNNQLESSSGKEISDEDDEGSPFIQTAQPSKSEDDLTLSDFESLSDQELNVINMFVLYENKGGNTLIEEPYVVKGMTEQSAIETRHALSELVKKRFLKHSSGYYSLTSRTRALVLEAKQKYTKKPRKKAVSISR